MTLTDEDKSWLEHAPIGYVRELSTCPDTFKKRRREFTKPSVTSDDLAVCPATKAQCVNKNRTLTW